MPRLLVSVLVLSSCLAVAGCGGGGGGSAPAADLALSVPAVAALSGTAQQIESDPAAAYPGTMLAGSVVVSGRIPFPFPRFGQGKALVSYGISAIPAGATILSAELTVTQVHVEGSPFTGTGPLLVDHVDLGAALDGADYDSTPLAAVIGALSTDAFNGPKTLDVTAEVQADVAAGRAVSSYRAYFGGSASGTVFLQDPTDVVGAGQPVPTLEIRYR